MTEYVDPTPAAPSDHGVIKVLPAPVEGSGYPVYLRPGEPEPTPEPSEDTP